MPTWLQRPLALVGITAASALLLWPILCAPALGALVEANGKGSQPANFGTSAFLTADRATTWNPGVRGAGGIPDRHEVCAKLFPGGKGADDAEAIEAAVLACPPGQVVRLEAGTFIIDSGKYILINRGITLRGAGPGRTTLLKPNGARPFQELPGPKPSPLIIVGPSRYTNNGEPVVASTDLTADAVKGDDTIAVANAADFSRGEIVLLDEASGASWQQDPQGRGQIWAAPDWRVVWKKHDPVLQYVDDFDADTFPTTPGAAGSWFSRADRPTAEVKEIASISGSTIKFTTPIHITYRIGNKAQLSRFWSPYVVKAGVEDLTLIGGDDGNLIFQWAALSWARNVESTQWHGAGIGLNNSFRIEVREFYVHDAAWAQPGGAGYAFSLAGGSSEALIENGIVVRANKLMVARSAGAGSVVGYNYMDMGYINTQGGWIEVGLNASHMVGSHHVLFEGNYSQNADSDETHGNSIYHTFFRNYLRGFRAPFFNQAGGKIDDSSDERNGPKRCAGLMAYSYWMSFVGNVLGAPGQMKGWVYEGSFPNSTPAIWMLGWDSVTPYPVDAKVAATALRHGNFDYLTNTVSWEKDIPSRDLPNSLYLAERPRFFDLGRGYTWPWVDPTGKTKLHEMPAKVRYDAGTPFVQP